MGAERMAGTPWHTEVLGRAEGDDRRHRSRCIYFQKDDKKCNYNQRKCIGSAHCTKYQEETWYNYNLSKEDNKENLQKKIAQPIPKTFKVGDKVSHFKYGRGVVENIKNDTITVAFEGVGKKLLSASHVSEKNILIKL